MTQIPSIFGPYQVEDSVTLALDSFYDSTAYPSKTAAINAAVAAAQAKSGVLEFQQGRTYSLDAGALQIAPGLPLKIHGNKATLQANWGKPRCIDFGSTSTPDYSTFQDVLIEDLICDANNLTSSNHESIIGNLFTGSWGRRVNATRIRLRRPKIINVPVGGGGVVYECFAIGSRHLASGETQTSLTDIRVEDAYLRGGDVGAAVIGTGVSGATAAGVEVYHDQIYLDVDHDTTVVPTSGSSGGANVQIGSVGWGDRCEVRVRGANSGDVGVEIDGMQTSVCTGTVIDAKNAMLYCRNFHQPRNVVTQKNTFRDCIAISRNVDKLTIGGTSKDFAVGGDATTTFAFGEMVLENCQSQIETALADWTNTTAMCIDVSNMYVRRVTVRNHRIGCHALNTNPGASRTYIFNDFWTADPNGIIDIDGIAVEWAGSVAAVTTNYEVARFSSTSGQTTKLNVRNITFDCSRLTTTTLTGVTFFLTHFGVNSSSFFTGSVERLKAVTAPVGGWTAVSLLNLNANFHVGGSNSRLQVADCDSALITTTAGLDYKTANSTQAGMLNIRSIAGRRTTGSPFGVPTAVTPPSTGVAYQNTDLIPIEMICSGGTVTNYEYSADNSTFFTLGLTAGKFRIEPGHYLRPTYSGTPTWTKVALA